MPRARSLSRGIVAATVFGAAAAVLTLEILAVRLLAPYVGLTIETYTTIIGVALAGIAAGAASGGRLADRLDPAALIAALLAAGGVLAMLTVPVVEWLGEDAGSARTADALMLALLTLGPPAAVLSGVTPAAAKLQVADLEHTGTEVGRISAWATAGALTGTFATGFVLVPLLSTRASVLAVGGACVLAGIVLGVRHRLLAGGAALAAAALGLAVGSPCDRDSEYFCARVLEDPARASGRILVLDDLRHAYVDLDDPRHLEFDYTRWVGEVIDAVRPAEAVFVGGGGFTLPRYLLTRPGTRATVLELDPEIVSLAREELGLRESERLSVRVGDARVRLRELPAASADLVVGDAFSSRSVPWHLTTREFVADLRRVLRPGGTYAVNVIDSGPLNLVRAVAATLRAEFAHVGLIAEDPLGGNSVLVASDDPLPRILSHDEGETARLAGDTDALTDDHAPADQLLTPAT
jgi:MFS family permease